MAAILSDGFGSVTDGVSIEGRTLDNALGGSGSRTWERAAGVASCIVGAGTTQLKDSTSTNMQGVSLGSNTNAKARIKFVPGSGGTPFIYVFGKSAEAKYGSSGDIRCLILSDRTTNGIRLRDQAGTDQAQANVPAWTDTNTYYAEIEINGNDCVARLLDSGLSVLASCSYTYPSGAPTGNYWGFDLSNANTNTRMDDFYMDDLAGGGGGTQLIYNPQPLRGPLLAQ